MCKHIFLTNAHYIIKIPPATLLQGFLFVPERVRKLLSANCGVQIVEMNFQHSSL
ncbi:MULTISPECIES: DUF6783 domain-containing protein [Blautia]|uniref:DUF6783 domain-containing protein n=1 Tax=Blautia TaxID=572511 RepID=UPI0038BB2B3F